MKAKFSIRRSFFKTFFSAFIAVLLLTSFVDDSQNMEGRPFWGEDCYSEEHTDALGQTCVQTCCTYYVFWIGVSTSCSWDCLGTY